MTEEYGISPYPLMILLGTVVLGLVAAFAAFKRQKRKRQGGAPRDQ